MNIIELGFDTTELMKEQGAMVTYLLFIEYALYGDFSGNLI